MKLFESLAFNKDNQPYFGLKYVTFITQHLLTFLSLVDSIYKHFDLNTAISLSFHVYTCNNLSLGRNLYYKEGEIELIGGPWRKDDLEIQSEIVDDLDGYEPEKVVKSIMDKFYNAFGLEASPDFDKNGKFGMPKKK